MALTPTKLQSAPLPTHSVACMYETRVYTETVGIERDPAPRLIDEHDGAVGGDGHLVFGVHQQQPSPRRLRLPESEQRQRRAARLQGAPAPCRGGP